MWPFLVGELYRARPLWLALPLSLSRGSRLLQVQIHRRASVFAFQRISSALPDVSASVGFTTTAALVHEMMEARDERRLLNLQKQLSRMNLMIIDELGFVPLSRTGAELLFEVFSQRYESRCRRGRGWCGHGGWDCCLRRFRGRCRPSAGRQRQHHQGHPDAEFHLPGDPFLAPPPILFHLYELNLILDSRFRGFCLPQKAWPRGEQLRLSGV